MDRDEKKKNAEELHEELKKAQGVILSGFQGITVAQDFSLRRKIAGTGARYKVVKNSLIERAAKGTPVGADRTKAGGNDLRGTHRNRSRGAGESVNGVRQGKPHPYIQMWGGGGKGCYPCRLQRRWPPCLPKSNCFPRCCFCSIHRRSGWHRRCRAWLATSPMLFHRP